MNLTQAQKDEINRHIAEKVEKWKPPKRNLPGGSWKFKTSIDGTECVHYDTGTTVNHKEFCEAFSWQAPGENFLPGVPQYTDSIVDALRALGELKFSERLKFVESLERILNEEEPDFKIDTKYWIFYIKPELVSLAVFEATGGKL